MNIKLNDGLLIQKVVDEVVILEPETGDYYTLNETGALMLEGLQQGKDITEIAQDLSRKFSVDNQEIKQDLYQLLTELEKNGLAHNQDA
ncbi:HPr-rel-A system PqqD family peptide chaperone [Paraglaciecola aquimarina]|uniref:HPr-rel-A system PqqD family peptide chaperone n=1 Tax=Paraglaciecola algarum TaxID=3050085 RepID=A0ABS9DC34_9ALTE|nr:HPr-rel-A system PqqD family peptide chaperone [Paraglaciecola sp. G1-23]MCF2949907.1 HPr-rel-A system PqqD family peptide chaperone [Paraglaciecola sp. G1-23]